MRGESVAEWNGPLWEGRVFSDRAEALRCALAQADRIIEIERRERARETAACVRREAMDAPDDWEVVFPSENAIFESQAESEIAEYPASRMKQNLLRKFQPGGTRTGQRRRGREAAPQIGR